MTATNYVTNPSFETNTTSWSFATGTTGSRSSTPTPGAGAWSLLLTSTGGNPLSTSYTVTGLTIGNYYIASAYVKTPSANNFGAFIQIAGSVSRATYDGDFFFVRIFVPFKATATSHTLTILSDTSNTSGDTFLVDMVSVADGPTVLPYFDGSYPYSAWTGTANASTSTNSAFTPGQITSREVVLVNGFCLNTSAWNVTTKTGRFTIPAVRGDNAKVPGARGEVWIPNKPLDSGTWSLSMFILGANADGTIPSSHTVQRIVFERNLAQLLQYAMDLSNPVVLHAWQPDGTVRTTKATMADSNATELTSTMAGARGELVLIFNILNAVWTDYLTVTTTGTASAAWSNQALSLPALAGATVPIEDAVITVTGPATNPRVTDPLTGVWVQYNGTVPSGQTWVVDSSQFTSLVNSVSQISNTTHAGYSKFLLIDPGTPTVAPSVTMTATATSGVTNLAVTAARQHYTA